MSNIHKNFNSRTRVGATGAGFRLPDQGPTSIHAPVWVRQKSFSVTRDMVRLQFTHPCGCDLTADAARNIKIDFNSRTRVGATA